VNPDHEIALCRTVGLLDSDLVPGNWSVQKATFPVGFDRPRPGGAGVKTSKISEQRIAFMLRQAEDGASVEEAGRI